MKITKSDFGTTKDGTNVHLFRMENNSGAYVEIIDFGARIRSLVVPDRNGTFTDVCLGYPQIEHYEQDDVYIGAIAGRVANRIKDGKFSLNGKTYQLAKNNGFNHLHGGTVGFDSKVWETEISDEKLLFTMHSPDGDEGYPGNLTLTAAYGWSEDNELSILYEAHTDADTILNVTNHAYFNLNHGKDILAHELFLDADSITEVDETQAPTGTLLPVENTPFDFRAMHTIGKMYDSDYEQLKKFGTYDHNFVINGTGFREAAVLQSKESGIRMTCFTDQPGIQLYVSDKETKLPGKEGTPYAAHTSLCLETQHFPDSVNHENFPSTVLHPNETFCSKTLYHFSTF